MSFRRMTLRSRMVCFPVIVQTSVPLAGQHNFFFFFFFAHIKCSICILNQLCSKFCSVLAGNYVLCTKG